jgi:hypothetical protein
MLDVKVRQATCYLLLVKPYAFINLLADQFVNVEILLVDHAFVLLYIQKSELK